MEKYKWYKNKKLTEQRVRQIITVGLPEVIKPEDVAEYGILPFVTPERPETTNLEIVVADGVDVTFTEVTQRWRVENKFDTLEEEQAYLNNIAEQAAAAQFETDNTDNIKSDALINTLKAMTMEEVEAKIDNGFSDLCGMSNLEIDANIDARTTVAQLKPVLKLLAKDIKWSIKILKIVTKIAVHILKRV
jgi:hypothetical protein